MSNAVISMVKEHPLAAGAVAVGVVVVVMLAMGGGSPANSQDTSGGAGVAAYYAAVANQTQAGAAVQIAEVQANAATNQTLIAATYGIETGKINADVTKYTTDAQERVATNTINTGGAVAMAQNSLGWHTVDQMAALGNSQAVASVQIAKANANASKPSTGQDIASVIGSIGGAAKSILPFF